MNTIKFSHWYDKLTGIEPNDEALLLQVIKTHYNDLSEAFIEYDTSYSTDCTEIEHYPLPKTDLLILIFQSKPSGRIFTTIRRWTAPKELYYESQVGRLFKIKQTQDGSE